MKNVNLDIEGLRDSAGQALDYSKGNPVLFMAMMLLCIATFLMGSPLVMPSDVDFVITSGMATMEKLSENYLTDPRIPTWQLNCVGAFVALDLYALLRGLEMIIHMII